MPTQAAHPPAAGLKPPAAPPAPHLIAGSQRRRAQMPGCRRIDAAGLAGPALPSLKFDRLTEVPEDATPVPSGHFSEKNRVPELGIKVTEVPAVRIPRC